MRVDIKNLIFSFFLRFHVFYFENEKRYSAILADKLKITLAYEIILTKIPLKIQRDFWFKGIFKTNF